VTSPSTVLDLFATARGLRGARAASRPVGLRYRPGDTGDLRGGDAAFNRTSSAGARGERVRAATSGCSTQRRHGALRRAPDMVAGYETARRASIRASQRWSSSVSSRCPALPPRAGRRRRAPSPPEVRCARPRVATGARTRADPPAPWRHEPGRGHHARRGRRRTPEPTAVSRAPWTPAWPPAARPARRWPASRPEVISQRSVALVHQGAGGAEVIAPKRDDELVHPPALAHTWRARRRRSGSEIASAAPVVAWPRTPISAAARAHSARRSA